MQTGRVLSCLAVAESRTRGSLRAWRHSCRNGVDVNSTHTQRGWRRGLTSMQDQTLDAANQGAGGKHHEPRGPDMRGGKAARTFKARIARPQKRAALDGMGRTTDGQRAEHQAQAYENREIGTVVIGRGRDGSAVRGGVSGSSSIDETELRASEQDPPSSASAQSTSVVVARGCALRWTLTRRDWTGGRWCGRRRAASRGVACGGSEAIARRDSMIAIRSFGGGEDTPNNLAERDVDEWSAGPKRIGLAKGEVATAAHAPPREDGEEKCPQFRPGFADMASTGMMRMEASVASTAVMRKRRAQLALRRDEARMRAEGYEEAGLRKDSERDREGVTRPASS
ncbi:hypothetical protein DFH09DRAFT_1076431 [Mycena vulgaris]|nr:hypothetical protein DFH09DRAFT_1076431 [Mycena vulgaris]